MRASTATSSRNCHIYDYQTFDNYIFDNWKKSRLLSVSSVVSAVKGLLEKDFVTKENIRRAVVMSGSPDII